MSELALRLIAENKKTRATYLDLGNCGLTEPPKELGELVWLESLVLASEWFEWDGQDWKYTKSQNVGATNERLVDMALLAKLSCLQALNIRGTRYLT